MRVLGTGHPTGRVDMLDQVAFPVVGPPLDRPVRPRPPRQLPFDRPPEPGRPAHRISHRDRQTEPVPRIYGDRPEGIGHRDRQTRGIRDHPPNLTHRIGDRRQPPTVVIGEPGPRPDRIDDARQVPPLVVGTFPAGTIRLNDRHR